MKWALIVLVVIVIGAAGVAIWARSAPSDPEVWHTIPERVPNANVANSAKREVTGSLATFDKIVRTTPRTTILAGAVEAGMVTYITRSAIFGFPDYTTVRQDGETLMIYARSRFGVSDLGVNAARVDHWLALLGQGGG